MGDKSKIEWTEATWNPIRARNLETGGVGHYCEKVSPGCAGCYAERMQPRFKNPIRYNAADKKLVEMFLDEDVLLQPLRWKRPRMIFPCSMTDLFGDWVTDEWLDKIFAVMALTPQHIFQVVTKRPERMNAYFKSHYDHGVFHGQVWDRITDEAYQIETNLKGASKIGNQFGTHLQRPLPNVWLGASAEDQKTADERIPVLLQTPAAIRWISAEPLLGAIDFTRIQETDFSAGTNALRGYRHQLFSGNAPQNKLDWIVCGGESGPNARPFDIQWCRSIIDQCKTAGVPVFVKQLGSLVEAQNADVEFPNHRNWIWGEREEGGGPILRSRKGGDMSEWPEDLRIREFPEVSA